MNACVLRLLLLQQWIALLRGYLFHSNRAFIQPDRRQTALQMSSDDRSLLEQMRKSLGEREDALAEAEQETKQLMQGLRELDRDPNMRANNKFVEWLGESGVWVKTTSAWGRAPHPLVIASNTEADGESCGRGLLARESMTEGELMMTVPLDLCLTKASAQETFGKEVIPDNMDEYIAIALLLMTERLKGSQSKWKPYFDVLPDAESVYPSYIWTQAELDTLSGSPVYYASVSLRNKVTREYEQLKTTTFVQHARILPVDKLSFELFLWSFVMLLSRAARLTSKINGEELALVPYADLMNHNPYSNTYIDAQRSGMPLLSRKEEVAVYADRSYKKFEQVFINYGEKGNGDLLLLYGFALDRNPFDSVDISVGLSKDDPMYDRKRAFLDKSGRGVTSVRFPLQRNRYPSELVDFLRLLLVEQEDLGLQSLERTDFNEPISPSLERRVLTTITNICESYIAQYPTKLEEDEVLTNDKMLFKALSRQQRMAVKLRASEKRILYQTIKAVQEELKKLPQAVKNRDEMVAAGRSFDVVGKARASITANAGTLGAFVDIREDPNKPAAKVSVDSADSSVESEDDSNAEDGGKAVSIAERRRRRRSGGSN